VKTYRFSLLAMMANSKTIKEAINASLIYGRISINLKDLKEAQIARSQELSTNIKQVVQGLEPADSHA
jgi:hypothetical protein